jgi:hypothetical protein
MKFMTSEQVKLLNEIVKYKYSKDEAIGEIINNKRKFSYYDNLIDIINLYYDNKIQWFRPIKTASPRSNIATWSIFKLNIKSYQYEKYSNDLFMRKENVIDFLENSYQDGFKINNKDYIIIIK